MDNDDAQDRWHQRQARAKQFCDALPLHLRKIHYHSSAVLSTVILIGAFEHFFFSNAFLKALFIVCEWKNLESRWLFVTLVVTLLADRGIRAKLCLAALPSSLDFFVELGLMFPVMALHAWRPLGQPLPGQRYVVAWGVLSSVVSSVVSAALADGRHEWYLWRRLAGADPESFCGSAEPLSLYTTCSHYAALALFLAELNSMFRDYRAQVEEECDEAPEAELTPPRIRMYRNRFLFWALWVRLSALVAFGLVSDASGSLQCWYAREGMEFLDWLPRRLRYLPFGVCAFVVHCLFRCRSIRQLLETMFDDPEDLEGDGNGEEDGDRDDEDWDDDGFNAEGFDDEDLDEEDLEEGLEDENDDEDEDEDEDDEDEDEDDDDDDENDKDDKDDDEDSTDDGDSIDTGGAFGGTDDWDDDEGGADYIYIHKDDTGYVFELKDGDRSEREAAYTYDGEHDYRYRYADAFGEVSVRSRATDRGYRVSYRYARKDAAGGGREEDELTDSVENPES
ncbi:hypothetical protein LY76DRAFT_623556 [Colletotrichum caudatum]|nr:hypothetical protein LY76DRAFT_623556 [Colletotrichum caudatum]